MNPLLAAVKGTSKTVSDATESTLQAAKNAVISPNVAYSLGMGIGPWLRNMANATDKKDDKKDKKNDSGLVKKEFGTLSSQFSTMISILRDLRSIGMTQLRADQQRLIESRKQEYFSKEAASERAGLLGGASITGTGKDGDGRSSLSILGDMMPTILKLLAGGGAAAGIWNYIFDDKSRDKIKASLFGEKGVWTTIADKYVEVLKSAPIETLLGTYIAARVTGVLGALGFAYKFAYHGGKIIMDTGKAVGDVMQPGASKSSGRPGLQAAVEAAELAQINRTMTTPGASATQHATTAGMSGPEKLKHNRLLRAEIASNNAAAFAAEEAAVKTSSGILSKLTPIISGAGKMLTHGLLGIGTVMSASSAAEDYKEGKTFAASLNALSATLGAGALASLFIPAIGPVAAGTMASLSAVTGLAGAAASYFESGSKKLPEQYHGPQGPQASATQSSDMDEQYGWTEEDWAKLGNIIGSKESASDGGYGAVERRHGNHIGRYQFGHEALIDVGLMKPEAKNKGTSSIWNKDYWTNGLSAEAFLASPELQEKAFRDFHRKNLAELQRQGLVNSSTAKKDIAAALMASQFGAGRTATYLRGNGDFADANGTRLSSYYNYARNSFDGASSSPGQSVASSIGPSSVTSADARSGGILGEMTQLAQDMNRLLAGGLMMASNDTNTTVNNATVTGGGAPSPRIDTSLIQQTTQHVAP